MINPTEKQLNFIKYIQRVTRTKFEGKTLKEAQKYIQDNIHKLPKSNHSYENEGVDDDTYIYGDFYEEE